MLKMHHPKICGSMHSTAHSHTISSSMKNKKINPSPPSFRDTDKKRSRSTPVVKPLISESLNFDYLDEPKTSFNQKNAEYQAPKSFLESSFCDEKEKSSSRSTSQLIDWNDSLRLMQEDYTKVVL